MRMASLALVTCLGVGLAACGTSNPQRPAAARSPRHLLVGASNARTGCPRGRLLPPGEGEAIDYVDFLQFNGRFYDQVHEPITETTVMELQATGSCLRGDLNRRPLRPELSVQADEAAASRRLPW